MIILKWCQRPTVVQLKEVESYFSGKVELYSGGEKVDLPRFWWLFFLVLPIMIVSDYKSLILVRNYRF